MNIHPIKSARIFLGFDWAMPIRGVRGHAWATACSITQIIKRRSGYRLACGIHHACWLRAIRVPGESATA